VQLQHKYRERQPGSRHLYQAVIEQAQCSTCNLNTQKQMHAPGIRASPPIASASPFPSLPSPNAVAQC
jgi:hypothetical protein